MERCQIDGQMERHTDCNMGKTDRRTYGLTVRSIERWTDGQTVRPKQDGEME